MNYNRQPGQGPYQPPNSFAPPPGPPNGGPPNPQGLGYGAPPSLSGFSTPVVTGPPISAQAGYPPYVGSPPTSMNAPPSMPAPNYGFSGYQQQGAPQTAPKASVQFFSVAGGNVTPSSSASTIPGPPPSTSLAGPPQTGGGGVTAPPLSGPPQGGFGAPPQGGSFGVPPPPTAAGVGAPPGDKFYIGKPQSTGAFEGGGQSAAYASQPSLDGLAPSTLPLLSEVDLTLQCNKKFLRPTVSKIVSSQTVANASRLPLGIIICPMAGDQGTSNDQVPVVDFGSTGIVRCKRCRTYINPFVVWMEGGRKWKCNICGLANETPSSYFSHLDAQNRRKDHDQRPELYSCSVEFVAPNDYQIRPPQPPTYLFLIDISPVAMANGMLAAAVQTIKATLGEIPGHPRTQVGFVTYDSNLQFYSLKSTLSAPQMLVISDLSDIILPLPEDLIVNLHDSRRVVEVLLDSLGTMFLASAAQVPPGTQAASISCLGSALAVAKHILEPTGGKVLLFQSTLPSIGEGTLKQRDNPRLLGTDKEHTLLNSEEGFYRSMALEYNKLQIAVDAFLFSANYTDVATLTSLCRYTSGSLYYYPAFSAVRDGPTFQYDLQRTLSRAAAFEAVMRVRATRGLRVTNFYGNYFIRGTDLMALPTCTSDSVFAIDLAFDEPVLQTQVVTVQAALLYTSSSGERRIRVHNLVVPVAASLTEMLETCDLDACVNLLAKQAVEIAMKAGLETARQRVHQSAIDIFKSLRAPQPTPMHGGYGGPQQSQPGEILVPASLQLLPLYAMALQKNAALRGGSDVRFDERSYVFQRVTNASVDDTRVFVYPRLFIIHEAAENVGLASDSAEDDSITTAGPDRIRLPSLLNLSAERLTSDGVFLLENSVELLMWVGRAVNPAILSDLFGVHSLEGVDMSTVVLRTDTDLGYRISNVVAALRADRPARRMHLHVIKEGDGYAEAYFSRCLVEDRANFQGGSLSYSEYYGVVLRSI